MRLVQILYEFLYQNVQSSPSTGQPFIMINKNRVKLKLWIIKALKTIANTRGRRLFYLTKIHKYRVN